MFECVKKGIREMLRSRLRSFLTVGSITVSVLAVVLICSIGEMGKTMINNQLSAMGMDSIVIQGDNDNYKGLKNSDIEVLKNLDGVENAMPLMNLYTRSSVRENEIKTMVWGVNEDADKIISLNAVSGRLIGRSDVISRAKVCVIDEQLSEDFYGTKNTVGRKIEVNINGIYEEFEIIGIVRNGVNSLQNMFNDVMPLFVYVPYSTLSDATSQKYFNGIAVKLEKEGINPEEKIKRAISFNKEIPVNIQIKNLLEQKSKMTGIVDVVTLILSLIAGISLIVSGMSIMNVMLVSVKERTREIGIKKAIGATNFNIMSEFLLEAIIITLAGGITGILIALILSFMISAFAGIPYSVDFGGILRVLAFSLITGLAFGGYPAYRAAKLKPVDALREF